MKLYSLRMDNPPYEIRNNKRRKFKSKTDKFAADVEACGIYEETFTERGTEFIFYTEPVRMQLFL